MLLNEMEIFTHVVDLKSFSRAAEKLDVSKSYISKHINQLEHELNAKLLIRSTRQINLTEAGHSFYQHCQKIVKQAQLAYDNIAELQGSVQGVLKVSIPPALANYLMHTIIPEFLQQYPNIKLNMQCQERVVDMIKGGYDIALRAVKLEDSTLVAKKIGVFREFLVASPNYIRQHGEPKQPNDLTKHNCATYQTTKANWTLITNQQSINVTVSGNFASNQLNLIKKLTLSHQCIAKIPEFMVKDELRQKKLIPILPKYKLPEIDLFAIYPAKEYLSPKTRVFINYLINKSIGVMT